MGIEARPCDSKSSMFPLPYSHWVQVPYFVFKFCNLNLHIIARSDRIRFKTKNPSAKLKVSGVRFIHSPNEKQTMHMYIVVNTDKWKHPEITNYLHCNIMCNTERCPGTIWQTSFCQCVSFWYWLLICQKRPFIHKVGSVTTKRKRKLYGVCSGNSKTKKVIAIQIGNISVIFG